MLTFTFTCKSCGLLEHALRVRYRRPDEHLQGWMDHVGLMMLRAHKVLSPWCQAERMTNLNIPTCQAAGVEVGMNPNPTPVEAVRIAGG